MDACVRIVFLLYFIATESEHTIEVQTQPSIEGHACFTDFLILVKRSDVVVFLVQVKKSSINTSLHLKSKETAQVLREAHILLQKMPLGQNLPFILTNGMNWSFGLGLRSNQQSQKIDICSIYPT